MSQRPAIYKSLSTRYFTQPPQGGESNAETRLSQLAGYLTPTALFYIRNHTATPEIDLQTWTLQLEGDGLKRSVTLDLAALQALPQVSVIRAIECAGNARAFFAHDFGEPAEGAQWRSGAIGVAEWSGVRLREVLEQAGVRAEAISVLPEGLDEGRFARPLPLDKALADDTLIALAMNGEPLPLDHGAPARLVVSGWLGAASIKWLGRISVATHEQNTYWNTRDYTLAGPDYPAEGEADGIPITMMPVMSMPELDWPAELSPGRQVIRGRAFSGEGRVNRVEYRLDDGEWQPARLETPNLPAAWVRWSVSTELAPGEHKLRVRAIDEAGNVQPDQVPWNDHGCLYNAVIAWPLHVGDR
ncbi:sulfite oxidase [Kushneria phosphatilytica]|uniref:Sulfite oxidase n=1 Tax=Kushneria phosphatilytica TaxID=657387 RepID=A0A1S1NSS2_9GAMM|nr:sulfite oxidase [Kushneria phosphatilytica]OHV08342.1 hypothetical protein BH688_13540 [Kushneria phosphatilytica]QEL09756.1 sulfite oxidase [Kushneria phosphatilytica]